MRNERLVDLECQSSICGQKEIFGISPKRGTDDEQKCLEITTLVSLLLMSIKRKGDRGK